MAFQFLYVTGGGFPDTTFYFQDRAQASDWMKDTTEVKRSIALINDNEGRNRNPDEAAYMPWLELVRTYKTKWGKQFVPPDVRVAVNDVEKNLGLEETTWN